MEFMSENNRSVRRLTQLKENLYVDDFVACFVTFAGRSQRAGDALATRYKRRRSRARNHHREVKMAPRQPAMHQIGESRLGSGLD